MQHHSDIDPVDPVDLDGIARLKFDPTLWGEPTSYGELLADSTVRIRVGNLIARCAPKRRRRAC